MFCYFIRNYFLNPQNANFNIFIWIQPSLMATWFSTINVKEIHNLSTFETWQNILQACIAQLCALLPASFKKQNYSLSRSLSRAHKLIKGRIFVYAFSAVKDSDRLIYFFKNKSIAIKKKNKQNLTIPSCTLP